MGKWILVKDTLPSKADTYITVTRNPNVPTVSFFNGKSFDKDVVAWYTTNMSRLYDKFITTNKPKEEYGQMTIDEWLANKKGE